MPIAQINDRLALHDSITSILNVAGELLSIRFNSDPEILNPVHKEILELILLADRLNDIADTLTS